MCQVLRVRLCTMVATNRMHSPRCRARPPQEVLILDAAAMPNATRQVMQAHSISRAVSPDLLESLGMAATDGP